MKQRLDYPRTAPEAVETMRKLDAYVRQSGLEPSLVELVKLRASLINGCAYCIDLHTKEALAKGETTERLFALAAWEEAPFFTDRERAALAWTDAETLVATGHVPDEVYEQARRHFTEKELVDLTLAIVAINGWNRIAIGFRAQPGTFRAGSSTRESAA